MKEEVRLSQTPQTGRNKEAKLGATGVALVGALAGGGEAVAQDTPKLISEPKRIEWKTTLKQNSVEDLLWFKAKIDARAVAASDVVRMEGMILGNDIPLSLQVQYLEHTLQKDGLLYKQLHSPELTEERLSSILSLASATATRLNKAYKEDRYNSSLRKYFAIDKVEKASRLKQATLPDGTKQVECNDFVFRSMGDVYRGTAEHCNTDYPYQSKTTDQAIRHIPPSEYWKHGITYAEELPIFSPETTVENASGRVAVSYSWGPDMGNGPVKKIHFSIALPVPYIMLEKIYGKDVYTKYPYMRTAMMGIKPPEEGKVLKYGPKGEVIQVGASGSSGSLVAVESGTEEGYMVVGNLVSMQILHDWCKKMCHSMYLFGGPSPLADMIKKEQRDRMTKTLGQGPGVLKKR